MTNNVLHICGFDEYWLIAPVCVCVCVFGDKLVITPQCVWQSMVNYTEM